MASRWPGALNLFGADTLYGRNWGYIAAYKHLHFEACYYRAIDFAIERGLRRVDGGVPGRHRIQRGYLPTPTYSAHWIRDAGFRMAIEDYLKRERVAVAQDINALMEESPFRRRTGASEHPGMSCHFRQRVSAVAASPWSGVSAPVAVRRRFGGREMSPSGSGPSATFT